MGELQYFKLGGIQTAIDQVASPQLTFIQNDNFILSRPFNAFRKRGGSYEWTHDGDIWGIGGFALVGASSKLPVTVTPIRHRRVGGTTYIEKLNWSTLVWDAVTQGAKTDFDIGDVASFAQIDTVLLVAAGQPAQIRDIAAGDIFRLGGEAPSTAATVATGAAGVLTGSYTYWYTFYDSTTGWESSPSPVSSTVSPSSQQVDLSALPTTASREGVDYKRIYRTIATGETPRFYVGQVALATTTYSDNIADASLGVESPEDGDHDAPPTESYIAHAHNGRFWIADGTALYYSKEFDGDPNQLEYYSADRVIYFPHNITGLASTRSGSLMVFHPPGYGVYEIIGRSEASFERVLSFPDEGTNYHASVSTHDDLVAYWGGDGPRVLSPDGVVQSFADNVRNQLRSILTDEYDTDIFVWSVWHPGSRAFLFGLSVTDSAGAAWVASSTSLSARWVDSTTGAIVDWNE